MSWFPLLGNLWDKRGLLLGSVKVELRTQYAGTVLGLIWIVLGPLLLQASLRLPKGQRRSKILLRIVRSR